MVSTFQALGISLIASTLFVLINWAAKGAWIWFGENLWLKLTSRHIPDIAGTWDAEFNDPAKNSSYRERIIIEQFGWKIKGHFTYLDTNPNSPTKDLAKEFIFTGIIRGNVLCAYYWGRDRNIIGSGSLTLRLRNEKTLKGGCVYYDPDTNAIVQDSYPWHRVTL
jgi:hypothetical protein